MMDKQCYCCKSMGSNLDSALNELGMLSAVTDVRKQYIQEQSRKAINGKLDETSNDSSKSRSVPNSPARGYQVLTMNPLFVTGLGSTSSISSKKLNFATEKEIQISSLGTDYAQEKMVTAQCSKIGRVKLARIKRFKTPYEVPWRLNAQLDELSNNNVETKSPKKHGRTNSMKQKSSVSGCAHVAKRNGLHRSKSMDDLDISKLNIVEAANHTVAQSKEIDNVSQHLKQMKVIE